VLRGGGEGETGRRGDGATGSWGKGEAGSVGVIMEDRLPEAKGEVVRTGFWTTGLVVEILAGWVVEFVAEAPVLPVFAGLGIGRDAAAFFFSTTVQADKIPRIMAADKSRRRE